MSRQLVRMSESISSPRSGRDRDGFGKGSSIVVAKEPQTTNETKITNDNDKNDKNNNDNNDNNNYNNNNVNDGSRSRRCNEKGLEFFREESLKNRTRCSKAIHKHILQIEELLQCGGVKDAAGVLETLKKDHQEFARAHSRILGLGEGTDEDEQGGLSLKVQESVAAVTAKVEGLLRVAEQKECEDQIDVLVVEVLNFIQNDCLPEAKNSMQDLNAVHQRFVSRCLGFSDQVANDEERVLSEKVLSRITAVRESLAEALEKKDENETRAAADRRASINSRIQKLIVEMKDLIEDGNLKQADILEVALDDLFGDFISAATNPTQGIDLAQESKFTDQVDGDVFAVKRMLAKAKSNLEIVNDQSRSLSNLSRTNEQGRIPLPAPHSKEKRSTRSRPSSSHGSSRSSTSKKSHASRKSRHEKSKRSTSPAVSHRSGSTVRSGSSTSSTQSAREKAMEEKARLAALRIESQYMEQSQKSILEKKRLEMEEARLEVEKEIAIATARAQVYDEHADIEEGSIKSQASKEAVVKKVDFLAAGEPKLKETVATSAVTRSSFLSSSAAAISPADPLPVQQADQLNHLNDLCGLLRVQSAPNVDVDYFDGNPLDFQYFTSLFEELIGKKIDDPLGKLARLIKYTRGEPKELIKHCIQMPQPDGYIMAKELLQKEYGDPHKVSSLYMKELRSWKPINSGDVNELKRYYRFLLKCHTNRKGYTYLNLLDNPETLRVFQSKLPYKMREKWTRRAVHQREIADKGELNFSDFVELVRMECKFLDDPVYSLLPDSVERRKPEGPGGSLESQTRRLLLHS